MTECLLRQHTAPGSQCRCRGTCAAEVGMGPAWLRLLVPRSLRPGQVPSAGLSPACGDGVPGIGFIGLPPPFRLYHPAATYPGGRPRALSCAFWGYPALVPRDEERVSEAGSPEHWALFTANAIQKLGLNCRITCVN